MVYHAEYDSPVGILLLTSDEAYLTGVAFKLDDRPFLRQDPVPEVLERTRLWLDSYFRGEAPSPQTLPLRPSGTPFQRMIWELLLEIPWGETRTYGDIARRAARIMGEEKMSPQAVGQAVGHNPVVLIIPCHRVLGAGGRLTGYAYGLDRKTWLLQHEKK